MNKSIKILATNELAAAMMAAGIFEPISYCEMIASCRDIWHGESNDLTMTKHGGKYIIQSDRDVRLVFEADEHGECTFGFIKNSKARSLCKKIGAQRITCQGNFMPACSGGYIPVADYSVSGTGYYLMPRNLYKRWFGGQFIICRPQDYKYEYSGMWR